MQIVPFETSPPLKHDGEFWISVGKSCFATNWKNQQMMWSRIIKKLSSPTRTPETYAEYLAMTRDEQNRVKDVGGFVGGTLKNGKRSSRTVMGRSIISYDLDFAPVTVYEDLKLTADYASACYSTHKHSPSSPRYRLLIPLARQVTAEEYEAVARMVAKDIGMDYFDPTTFQPSRLMYWPSVSEDGEFYFDYMDAPFLDPDEVLASYGSDWRDVSLWPTHPKEKTQQRRQAEKQEDPTTKAGVVGAFCRAYDVPAVISKFLPEVYTPTAKDDRYTYAEGTTAAGLVIYEGGKFAFSNHSTDPACGQLCNAFDLVRIHKFGDLDASVKSGTPTNELPSYKAMLAFAVGDADTVQILDDDRRRKMRVEFDEDDDSGAWKTEITRDKSGNAQKTVQNCQIIFQNDPALRGIALNLLSRRIDVLPEYPVPWERKGGSWTDTDDAQLYTYVGRLYAEFPRVTVTEQKLITADRHAYHPVKKYLETLPAWDDTKRVDTLFIDYLGAEDTIYTREVTAKMLIAAVMRIYEPGCKFDPMLVISGPPGIGKSTILNWLAGDEWFSDNLTFSDMSDKTAAENIQGYWIIEISEMKGMRKMDVESIKAFVSRRTDIYRPAYGKNTEEHPRQCVIFGTVNDISGYLKDITGNRRFWPVNVTGNGRLSVWGLTSADRDQVWAEVMRRYKSGERRLTLSSEAEQIAVEKQTAALESDDREGIVEDYLNTPLPDDWSQRDQESRLEYLDDPDAQLDCANRRMQVTIGEIWCECFRSPMKMLKKQDSYDISSILKRLGWVATGKRKRVPLYGQQRTFIRSKDSKPTESTAERTI